MIGEQLRQGYYQASGTVLLRKEASKGGRSLLLFLRGFGPRWAGAPAAGGKNRFGGGAEPMVWGSFSLYRSPTRLYLQSVDVKEDFLPLRRSPAALACAARLYRLTAAEAPADCENDGLLRTLWSAMVQLRDGAIPAAVEFRYMWRLLAAMGTAPSLEYCAGCGERLARGGLFTDEGILCGRCAARAKGAPLSERELLVLRAAAALPHAKFVEWAAKRPAEEIFAANIKKLSSYFRNLL
ncbi:MAG TPA: DNA repair protein RecO C-terminal domain-containing protein [Candidatus Caccocola faecigallinarum]|nr:DNA repair protein RecO C-terminal domain-containing protein [Candidatus Caccocola faecigallinarum]